MILSISHEAQLFAAIAAMVRAAYSWPRLKSSRPFPVGTSFQYPARARRPPPFNLTNGRVFREGASVRRACSGLLEAALKSNLTMLALPGVVVVARGSVNLAPA